MADSLEYALNQTKNSGTHPSEEEDLAAKEWEEVKAKFSERTREDCCRSLERRIDTLETRVGEVKLHCADLEAQLQSRLPTDEPDALYSYYRGQRDF